MAKIQPPRDHDGKGIPSGKRGVRLRGALPPKRFEPRLLMQRGVHRSRGYEGETEGILGLLLTTRGEKLGLLRGCAYRLTALAFISTSLAAFGIDPVNDEEMFMTDNYGEFT